ncbi:hypothetical protein AMTRI_Chr11g100770 [Amborella trichopoda]
MSQSTSIEYKQMVALPIFKIKGVKIILKMEKRFSVGRPYSIDFEDVFFISNFRVQ